MTLWERLRAATIDAPVTRKSLTPLERRQADKWHRRGLVSKGYPLSDDYDPRRPHTRRWEYWGKDEKP